MTIEYELKTQKNDTLLSCIASLPEEREICSTCHVYAEEEHQVWTIAVWYTNDGYKNQGIGKQTLAKIITYLYVFYGKPSKIKYIWNGAHQYVYDWMVKHFDAVCQCPIVIQKTQAEDDWDSHIYNLNVDKVLKYFELL